MKNDDIPDSISMHEIPVPLDVLYATLNAITSPFLKDIEQEKIQELGTKIIRLIINEYGDNYTKAAMVVLPLLLESFLRKYAECIVIDR